MTTSCIQCVPLLLFFVISFSYSRKNTFVSSLLELPAGAKVIRSWYRVGAEKNISYSSLRHTKKQFHQTNIHVLAFEIHLDQSLAFLTL